MWHNILLVGLGLVVGMLLVFAIAVRYAAKQLSLALHEFWDRF